VVGWWGQTKEIGADQINSDGHAESFWFAAVSQRGSLVGGTDGLLEVLMH